MNCINGVRQADSFFEEDARQQYRTFYMKYTNNI